MKSLLYWIKFHQEKKEGFFKSLYKGFHTFKELYRMEKSIVKLGRR